MQITQQRTRVGILQNPLNCGGADPITARALSGYSRRFWWVFVLAMFGYGSTLVGCSSSAGESAQEAAQRERLRAEAPGVFDSGSSGRADSARVFADPEATGEAPMTQALSIDGTGAPTTGARAPVSTQRTTSTGSDPDGWAILLERISGPSHEQRARERASVIARALRRSDVRSRAVSSGSAVVMGGYTGPDDERAQRDLEYVKSLVSGGVRPYAMAILVPPPVEQGDNTRYSLVEAAKGMEPIFTHTLQVAVFAGDEAQRRADAERYTQQLRRQGQEAYYFHGRRVSSVTIGAFTSRDFDLNTGVVSARLEKLQEEFPHNLYNGEIQRDRETGDPWNSALVLIPRAG